MKKLLFLLPVLLLSCQKDYKVDAGAKPPQGQSQGYNDDLGNCIRCVEMVQRTENEIVVTDTMKNYVDCASMATHGNAWSIGMQIINGIRVNYIHYITCYKQTVRGGNNIWTNIPSTRKRCIRVATKNGGMECTDLITTGDDWKNYAQKSYVENDSLIRWFCYN